MICGGGEYVDIDSRTDATCGRIRPLIDASWDTSTTMPGGPRTMVEAVNLLDGSILWLNGAHAGAQGFGIADDPSHHLITYHPANNTWTQSGRSDIARLYHSVALPLRDGRILIAGSNPNEMPVWSHETDTTSQALKYATELRMEVYTPPYLQGISYWDRPRITRESENLFSKFIAPGEEFWFEFESETGKRDDSQRISVVLYMGGFVTHSLHMGQQMYMLDIINTTMTAVGMMRERTVVAALVPPIKMAPGEYFLYVLDANGVPSDGELAFIGAK